MSFRYNKKIFVAYGLTTYKKKKKEKSFINREEETEKKIPDRLKKNERQQLYLLNQTGFQ